MDEPDVSEPSYNLLPVQDPSLLTEWRMSLADLLRFSPTLAAQTLADLAGFAKRLGVSPATQLPVNDISPKEQPSTPGNAVLEREIENAVRWNAMSLVQRANHDSPGIGGHLSTFASSATIIEVLQNHIAKGPSHQDGPDRIFFQGHASPGIYARAALEGRFDVERLDLFRRELSAEPGLSSYPHPFLMPGFWEFPTVSMGIGPLCAIFQALLDRHLFERGVIKSLPRTFCFIGDGECDEPETLGAIATASREQLSNLVFIVVCNLQRLDGPVRGGSSIVKELAGVFSGASWRVIKSLWGSSWDDLFDSPHGFILASRLASLTDGDLQRLSASDDAKSVRVELENDIPELASLFSHLDDTQVAKLLRDRAGHDRDKVFAALDKATSPSQQPTAVLVMCEKGFALPSVSSKMSAHQVKGLSAAALTEMAANFGMDDVIAEDVVPQYASLSDEAHAYLVNLTEQKGGPLPSRAITSSHLPLMSSYASLEEFERAPAKDSSTTMAHTRLLRQLLKDPALGPSIVPIVADEGRTFGFESLYSEFGVHLPPAGQGSYKAADAHMTLAYKESSAGRFLQTGISEASALALFMAAGQFGYRGPAQFPIYEYYSMFGFQRVADLIWAAQDAGCSGMLVGATAGRTTLNGEGLQHQDGHSQLWVQSFPHVSAFDPSFGFELRDFYVQQLEKAAAGIPALGYVTVYNENMPLPSRPASVTSGDVLSGAYVFDADPASASEKVALCFSGVGYQAALDARALLAAKGVRADLVSVPSPKLVVEAVTEYQRAVRMGQDTELPAFVSLLRTYAASVFVSDWVAQLIAPVQSLVSNLALLGTDGVGRSAERSELRRFFGTDQEHVALAALAMLDHSETETARTEWGIASSSPYLR